MKILRKIRVLLAAGALLLAAPALASDFQVDRHIEDPSGNSLSLDDNKPCDVPELLVGVPEEVQKTIRAARVYFEGKVYKACYIEFAGTFIRAYDETGDHVGDFHPSQFKRPVRVGS